MHNFDPDKSTNPFAYFTQIIYYAFLRRIQKEKKQQYAKYKYFDQKAGFEQMDTLQEHDKESFDFLNERGSVNFHIHIKEFIDEMERKEKEKKHKRELKKAEKDGKVKADPNNLELFYQ
jgi:DNA-directed RNA polymerase specialized sigma24 family protein